MNNGLTLLILSRLQIKLCSPMLITFNPQNAYEQTGDNSGVINNKRLFHQQLVNTKRFVEKGMMPENL